MKTKVASNNSDIGAHDLIHFLDVLSDEDFLLVRHRAFVVPFRHFVIVVVLVDDFQRVLGCCVGIDDSFDERVAGQTIAAVQTCAGAFTDGIKSFDAALPVEIYLDAAAHVVCAGRHRNVLLRDVDADGEALGVDVGEVMLGLLRIFVGDIEADVIQSMNLHLAVNGASHNIARCQRESFVIFLHELLPVGKTKNAAITSHRLCDEVGWMRFLRVVEDCRMELHELHILHFSLGTIDHSYAVASRDIRVGGGGVNGSSSSRRHKCDLAQVGIHLACIGVEDVSTITFDVWSTASDADSQVMLSDDLDCKVVLQHFDVGILTNGSHQSALNLGSSIVGMMQDAEL